MIVHMNNCGLGSNSMRAFNCEIVPVVPLEIVDHKNTLKIV